MRGCFPSCFFPVDILGVGNMFEFPSYLAQAGKVSNSPFVDTDYSVIISQINVFAKTLKISLI